MVAAEVAALVAEAVVMLEFEFLEAVDYRTLL